MSSLAYELSENCPARGALRTFLAIGLKCFTRFLCSLDANLHILYSVVRNECPRKYMENHMKIVACCT